MSLSDAAESSSSRARREAEPELEPDDEQRKWVVLASVPVPLPHDDDEGARTFALGTFTRLVLQSPPSVSRMFLHPRLSPDSTKPRVYYYIVAADRSGRLLLQIVQNNRPGFLLYDALSRKLKSLPKSREPATDSELGVLHVDPRRSIGLLAYPHPLHGDGALLLAQLRGRTTSGTSADRLLRYSSIEGRWEAKLLSRSLTPMPDPSSEQGVLAHGGKLWWLSLAYGLFFCDPLVDNPRLNFLPLPDGCQMSYETSVNQKLIDQCRCVRASEGALRYVEIGLPYAPALATVSMWTLIEEEGGDDPWRFEYKFHFSDIWDRESFIGSGLTPHVVPHVALIDPQDHFVVYFFQGSSLFSIHMRDKRVGTCEEHKSLDDDRQFPFRSSRSIVDAWELLPPPQQPHTPPSDQPASASPAHERQIFPVQAGQKIRPP